MGEEQPEPRDDVTRHSLPPELPLSHEVNGLQCRVSLGPWQTRREPDQDSAMLSSGSPEPALAVTGPPRHQEGKGTHVGSPICSGACWCLHQWQGARSGQMGAVGVWQ